MVSYRTEKEVLLRMMLHRELADGLVINVNSPDSLGSLMVKPVEAAMLVAF